ncbi:purine-nucleoside phosphorylase [Sandaracinus amylolyticus]|uniref:Purine nucleoside phosphorylase n=1 Tax=Sandaracinus amylolyticus TaxID=927083 RepID=A0A0F6SET2_9BACT|nr:purine-nucleoside phosphorylase [Sandaracinus amylolyticus]AKF05739.1 Purine nucleoside phosphorylase [Sandaracinus amylolyticus]
MAHAVSSAARLEEAVAAVRARTDACPRVALVLGSGLGSFADTLEGATRIPYEDIPGMPVSGVAGHAGRLVIGRAEGVPCVAMQGRVHLYEGHDPGDVVFGLRLMMRLGAKVLVVTNAAGGANPALEPGDLMLIEDHLNMTGRTPLLGPNDEALGPRFPDMSEAYDPGLRRLARKVAGELGIPLRGGVYAGLLGPSYETPAEIRMLQRLGADAVGMSTVLETIAARHAGARVLGISCITNKGAGLSAQLLDHAEVQEVADRVRDRFVALLRGVLAALAKESG